MQDGSQTLLFHCLDNRLAVGDDFQVSLLEIGKTLEQRADVVGVVNCKYIV